MSLSDIKIKRETRCKSALSASTLSDTDLSLNPYVGCAHGCYYCYAPYVTHRDPEEWTSAKAKINIAEILQKELKSGKAYHKKVELSTVTDPYQPLEREYKLTRKCLIELLNYNAYPSIQTKSSLVLRDIDIIRRFEEREVGFTLTSLNPFYEPYADPPEKRIEALRILKGENIRTFVFIGPVMPHYTTEELIEELRKVEPDYVVVDRLRIKKGMDIKKMYSSLEPESLEPESLEPGSLEMEAEEVRRLCLSYGLNLVEQHIWKNQP